MKIVIILIFLLLDFTRCRYVQRPTATITSDSKAEAYLEKYGYIPKHRPISYRTAQTEKVVTNEGIKFFQEYNHLNITGTLNEETLALMNAPRCGVEDEPTHPGMPKAFSIGRGWNKNRLTYRISLLSRKMSESVVRSAFVQGFAAWSAVCNINAIEVQSAPSDIDIRFETRDHGDGYPFDGPGGAMAHAFFPSDGRMHLDEEERWDGTRPIDPDIERIAVHEVGHILGIGHSNVRGATMNPFFAGFNPFIPLIRDDILACQALYGPPIAPTTTTEAVTRSMMNPNGLMLKPLGLSSNVKPLVCNMGVQAAVKSQFLDKTLMFLDDTYVATVDDDKGLEDLKLTESVFKGVYYNPKAAFTVEETGHLFLMTETTLYEFDDTLKFVERFSLKETFPETPNAALSLSDGTIFIFGATKVWKFDSSKKTSIPGSNRPIDREFPGVPDRVDAALHYDSQKVYFFKDLNYYLYDLETKTVTEGGLTTDVGERFFKGDCIDEK